MAAMVMLKWLFIPAHDLHWRPADKLCSAFVGLAALAFLLWAIPASYWYRIDAVHISDVSYPHDVSMTVERRARPHRGDFQVQVRRAENGQVVCTAPQTPYRIPYGRVSGPAPYSLEGWMGDDDGDVDRCIASGLGAGQFYVETYHTVYWLWFRKKTRPVGSNVFTIRYASATSTPNPR